jgi:hypothetical protein
MAGNALRSDAWKTVAAVLLTSIPLAERMLLYHVAMTACILLPVRPINPGYHHPEPRTLDPKTNPEETGQFSSRTSRPETFH